MDMSNAEMLAATEMTWHWVGPGQENLTHHPERETLAAYAELYTEDGALLLAMSHRHGLSTWWGPDHSELLGERAMANVPYVERIDQLDMHMILDLETEDARRAS